MKVYQLVAAGQLKFTGERRVVHSKKAYRSRRSAKKATPNFRAQLITLSKGENDLNIMVADSLRIFVETLEVVL